MSNSLLTIVDITNEAARLLEGKLGFTKLVNRSFDDRFARTGAKIGDTTNVRMPILSAPTSGAALQLQNLEEKSKPVTLDTQYQQAFSYSSKDRSLSMDQFADRYIAKKIAALAAHIDSDGLKMALANSTGLVGTIGGGFADTVAAQRTIGQAKARILNAGYGYEDLVIVGTPDFMTDASSQFTNVFNAGTEGRDEFRTGLVSTVGGFDWYQSTYMGVLGGSTYAGTPEVASTSNTTVTISGFSGAVTLVAGTVFEIDGVYAVNPLTKQSTGKLKQFSVKTSVSGTGTITVVVSEEIVASGIYQNVSVAPAAGADIHFPGQASGASTSSYGIAMTRDSFVFANADLDYPDAGAEAHRVYIPSLDISVRAVTQYNINTDATSVRLDVLGGWAPLYNQTAVKIAA